MGKPSKKSDGQASTEKPKVAKEKKSKSKAKKDQNNRIEYEETKGRAEVEKEENMVEEETKEKREDSDGREKQMGEDKDSKVDENEGKEGFDGCDGLDEKRKIQQKLMTPMKDVKFGFEVKKYELEKNIDRINELLYNVLKIKESKDRQRCEKDFQDLRDMSNIDLVQILKGKYYPLKLERLINSKEIVINIKLFLMDLRCSIDDCPHKAKLIYISENDGQIYCDAHANINEHTTKPLKFKSELSDCKSSLYELEKKLIFVQMQMAFIRNENSKFAAESPAGK